MKQDIDGSFEQQEKCVTIVWAKQFREYCV